MFPAYHAFHADPGRTYTRWVVYTALVDALDFATPREMKLDAIVAMCKVSRTAAAKAREFLITHGYLIEHTRDRRGLPTLTLAYNIGDPMTTPVATPVTTSAPPPLADRLVEVVRLAGLFLDHLGHHRAEVSTPAVSHRSGGELWRAIREVIQEVGGLDKLRARLQAMEEDHAILEFWERAVTDAGIQNMGDEEGGDCDVCTVAPYTGDAGLGNSWREASRRAMVNHAAALGAIAPEEEADPSQGFVPL